MFYPKSIKKISIVFAALLLLALPGCGKPAASGASPSANGTAQVSPTSAGAPADSLNEPITLTVARFDLPADMDSSDLFTTEGAKYYDAKWAELAQKFNVKITYRPVGYTNRDDAIRQMIASGDMPGAMLTTLSASECRDALAKGLIRSLPQGFEQSYANIASNMTAVRRRDEYKTSESAYCAIPRALEGAEPYTDTTLGIYYRKDIAARSGITCKDAYTLDELYAIFERVQADNPGLAIYESVSPRRVLELGIAEAVPETAQGFGFYKSGTGRYAYAFQSEALAGGIKTFKKFYDAGFLDRDFNERPLYEARARFADGSLFCCSDALDIPTADVIMKDFAKANPETNPADAMGFAWILNSAGNMVALESGNSWSEWIFGSKMDDRSLARFLTIYDYLLSADGLALAVPGSLGSVTPLIAGALEDSRVCALNPAYSDTAKQWAGSCRNVRYAAENISVLPFDTALDGFTGEQFTKAPELAPMETISRIIRATSARGVTSAWQKWLDDKVGVISGILDELNANLPS